MSSIFEFKLMSKLNNLYAYRFSLTSWYTHEICAKNFPIRKNWINNSVENFFIIFFQISLKLENSYVTIYVYENKSNFEAKVLPWPFTHSKTEPSWTFIDSHFCSITFLNVHVLDIWSESDWKMAFF